MSSATLFETLLLDVPKEVISRYPIAEGSEASRQVVLDWLLARNREFIAEMIPDMRFDGR